VSSLFVAAFIAHAHTHAPTERAALRQFWVRKYEAEAARNWDLFYKRNADRFFKDRRASRACLHA
jgi:hypothetical protein